ncbi:GbsR/MarR family transcriptional regulator [Sphaerisporangium corydalis]|uniref:GbsR/MarR family transcriptional regulator n=1 Tax=Sphaerisporangium corydalis TaxID=1441875 RepID=A0ABV9EP20_9ACTN|nr:MarR family transcriptional regulator [Sphaerisporangium corydalis]
MTDSTKRDQQAILRFIERFASILADAGMPRMPARVFAALFATDSGRLTAAELAGVLGVSPAAISGAVRYLIQLNLAAREREPGSRRDQFRILDDVWYEAELRRDQMISQWEGAAREGVEALGEGTPAGERIAETLAYFEFVQQELPQVLNRWRAHRAHLRAARNPGANDPG